MSDLTTGGQAPGGLQDFAALLEQLGLYKYADDKGIERAKAEAYDTGFLFGDGTRRSYFADEEDLAEGGVEELLREVQGFLERQGVVIESLTQDFNEDRYTVTMNGVTYLIHTGEEAHTEQLWALTTKRAFSMIDALLTGAGSDERAHLLYGWNDGNIVFLAPDLYNAIKTTDLLPDREKPVSIEDMP